MSHTALFALKKIIIPRAGTKPGKSRYLFAINPQTASCCQRRLPSIPKRNSVVQLEAQRCDKPGKRDHGPHP